MGKKQIQKKETKPQRGKKTRKRDIVEESEDDEVVDQLTEEELSELSVPSDNEEGQDGEVEGEDKVEHSRHQKAAKNLETLDVVAMVNKIL